MRGAERRRGSSRRHRVTSVDPFRARWTFFGGKGGVGKTTLAAANALAFAEAGRRVLLASVDPAHSLGDAFGLRFGPRPRAVRLRPARRGSLAIVEIAQDVVLEEWLAARRPVLEALALRGTYLDESDVERFVDLSMPGIGELLALVELRRLASAARYDEIVVDSAPTGHAVRLLQTPATLRAFAQLLADLQAKHHFLVESLGGGGMDDADLLVEEVAREADELASLVVDITRTRMRWVTLPELLSIEETRDALAALDAEGVLVSDVIVDRCSDGEASACPSCEPRRRAEAAALKALRTVARHRPIRVVPTFEPEPRGIEALRRVGRALAEAKPPTSATAARVRSPRESKPAGPAELPFDVPRSLRVLFFGGKGGVGKSTCAAAAAIAWADAHPLERLLLLSTDPAHSLADVLARRVGDVPRPVEGGPQNLEVRELDARQAFGVARDEWRRAVGELFDRGDGGARFEIAFDRQVLEDLGELRPPGLDELFATLGVVDAVAGAGGEARRWDRVFVDLAPTGHALHLLQMAGTAKRWVRALLATLLAHDEMAGFGRVAAELVKASRGLRELESLLADSARARFVVVTRAAELPRAETLRLIEALGRLRVAVGAVVVNALASPACPRCRRAAGREGAELTRLARSLSGPRRRAPAIVRAPAVAPPPRGVLALRRWVRTWRPSGIDAPLASVDKAIR